MAEPHGFRRSPLLDDPKTRFFVLTSHNGENLVKSVNCNAWATQRKNEQKLNDAFHAGGPVILLFSVNKSNAFQGYARMRGATGRCSVSGDPFGGFGRNFDIEWQRLHDLDIGEVAHLRNNLDDARNVGLSRDGQELEKAVGSEVCRLIDICVYNEDPKSFEPVVDDPAPLKMTSSAQQMSSSSSSSTRPGPPPPASTPPPPHHGYGHGGLPPPPAHSHGQAPPGHFGGSPPLPHPSYAEQPHVGYPPSHGYYPPPAAPHGLPAPYGAPPHGTLHSHAAPQHGPPPAHWAGSRPRRRERGGRRRKRRRRSTSSSSTSSEEGKEGAEGQPQEKKEKKQKSKDGPDFLNMTYDEYVQWWTAKHGGDAAAAGAPGKIEGAAAATGPAMRTPIDALGKASAKSAVAKADTSSVGSIFAAPAKPAAAATSSSAIIVEASSQPPTSRGPVGIAASEMYKKLGQKHAQSIVAEVAAPVQQPLLQKQPSVAATAESDSETTSSAESDLPELEEAATASGLAWAADSSSSEEGEAPAAEDEVAAGTPATDPYMMMLMTDDAHEAE